MSNLITEKQKKTIRLEYLVRLIAMILLIASLLGAFLLAYLIPYYISTARKDLMVAEQFNSVIMVENKENVGESVSRIVTRTVDEMNTVELYNASPRIASSLFGKVIANKNSNVRITQLSFTVVGKNQGQVLANGTAQNRDSLVRFIEDLKSKAGFATVDSPISDFAKDSDIVFSLNIKTTI